MRDKVNKKTMEKRESYKLTMVPAMKKVIFGVSGF
jgi:hypothetical protein